MYSTAKKIQPGERKLPVACSVPDAKERMSLFAGGIKEDKGVKDLYRGGANCKTAMCNNVKIYYCVFLDSN